VIEDEMKNLQASPAVLDCLKNTESCEVHYIAGKIYYFDGKTVFMESEKVLDCQSYSIVWHRPNPKQADASLVNVFGLK